MNRKKINFRLADLRRQKKITQEELACHLDTTFQTISKWENGVCMPDVTVLPVLASFFSVTVDELLGLKPLDGEIYISSETSKESFWNEHTSYMTKHRNDLINSDYLDFLIKSVWKITGAVKLLDCGCGCCDMAPVIMPHLPENSTYTGIDFSDSLVKHGEKTLEKYRINGEVIRKDILSLRNTPCYDMILCQSVLRNTGNAVPYIEKMLGVLKRGGLIVCIDSNREFECDGLYISGLDYSVLCDHEGAVEHWKKEYENNDRDWAAAMRCAHIMREVGIKDIGIRMCDKVEFICPENGDYAEKISRFMSSDIDSWYDNSESAVKQLVSHGMTKDQAEKYIKREKMIKEHIEKSKENVCITKFDGKMITYGRKA